MEQLQFNTQLTSLQNRIRSITANLSLVEQERPNSDPQSQQQLLISLNRLQNLIAKIEGKISSTLLTTLTTTGRPEMHTSNLGKRRTLRHELFGNEFATFSDIPTNPQRNSLFKIKSKYLCQSSTTTADASIIADGFTSVLWQWDKLLPCALKAQRSRTQKSADFQHFLEISLREMKRRPQQKQVWDQLLLEAIGKQVFLGDKESISVAELLKIVFKLSGLLLNHKWGSGFVWRYETCWRFCESKLDGPRLFDLVRA